MEGTPNVEWGLLAIKCSHLEACGLIWLEAGLGHCGQELDLFRIAFIGSESLLNLLLLGIVAVLTFETFQPASPRSLLPFDVV